MPLPEGTEATAAVTEYTVVGPLVVGDTIPSSGTTRAPGRPVTERAAEGAGIRRLAKLSMAMSDRKVAPPAGTGRVPASMPADEAPDSAWSTAALVTQPEPSKVESVATCQYVGMDVVAVRIGTRGWLTSVSSSAFTSTVPGSRPPVVDPVVAGSTGPTLKMLSRIPLRPSPATRTTASATRPTTRPPSGRGPT